MSVLDRYENMVGSGENVVFTKGVGCVIENFLCLCV